MISSLLDTVRGELSARGVEPDAIRDARDTIARLHATGVGALPTPQSTDFHYDRLANFLKSGAGAQPLSSWRAIRRPFSDIGYKFKEKGKVSREDLVTGDKALYWTGDRLDWVIFNPVKKTEREFECLSDQILPMRSSKGRTTAVLDLGAGAGAFSLHLVERLKALGYDDVRIVNIDYDPLSLVIAEMFVERHKLGDVVANVMMDVQGALHDGGAAFEGLRGRIVDLAGVDFQTILHTNVSLFRYDEDECRALIDTAINRLHCRGGVHWEFCGATTPTFAALCHGMPEAIRDLLAKGGSGFQDVFAFLMRHADDLGIIAQRVDIPPHVLHQHVPSALRWRRR